MTVGLVGTSGFAAIPTTALDLPLVQRLRRSPRFRVRIPVVAQHNRDAPRQSCLAMHDYTRKSRWIADRPRCVPKAAPAVLYAFPSLPIGTRRLALKTTWDLPSLTAGTKANIDVTVPGGRRDDFADASLIISSIAFVLDCHVWSNNSVRVTARNVSASTVDLAAVALSVQVVTRRVV